MMRFGWLAFPLLALVVQGALPACSADRPLRREAATRHSKHGVCFTCHRTNDPSPSQGSAVFAGGVDPSAACLDCHHYQENHHPVDFVPRDSEAIRVVSTFPLINGRVQCLTCHQAHANAGSNNLSEPSNLLRSGPLRDRRDICFLCHRQEAYQDINPHKMLTPSGAVREVNGAPVCLLCHSQQPTRDSDPADVSFKADVAFLCWRCHSSMTGTFMEKHHHAKVKKATRKQMEETVQAKGIDLPLARDGMITCSTCHNPHEQGVLMRTAADVGTDKPHRLRLAKKEACNACHAM
jgi:hypothetical protein